MCAKNSIRRGKRNCSCHLRRSSGKPILIGTWKAATWAIAFYEKHGFTVVSDAEARRLLKQYWNVPERQVETSVVLVDDRFLRSNTA